MKNFIDEGYKAFEKGLSIDDCPYRRPDVDRAARWYKGWRRAEEELNNSLSLEKPLSPHVSLKHEIQKLTIGPELKSVLCRMIDMVEQQS